jgi:hypothetical protein
MNTQVRALVNERIAADIAASFGLRLDSPMVQAIARGGLFEAARSEWTRVKAKSKAGYEEFGLRIIACGILIASWLLVLNLVTLPLIRYFGTWWAAIGGLGIYLLMLKPSLVGFSRLYAAWYRRLYLGNKTVLLAGAADGETPNVDGIESERTSSAQVR